MRSRLGETDRAFRAVFVAEYRIIIKKPDGSPLDDYYIHDTDELILDII